MTRFARSCKNCDFSKTTWWLKTTLPRIGQLGTKIYQQKCVLDDWVWTLKMNVWTASFWWVYINTKTPKVLGNALVNMLALQRRFWILSILYLGSGCLSQYDSQAFLFSLVNKPGWAPVKFDQTGGYSANPSHSTYSCYNGPVFGGPPHDLKLAKDGSHDSFTSDLGYTYSPPSTHGHASLFAREFLAGSYRFNPAEIETFYYKAFTSHGRIKN